MMRDFVRRNTRLRMLIPVVLAFGYLAPSAIMPSIWIDLRAVQITDAVSADGAWVAAERQTHLGFPGRFQVMFRDAASDDPVCTPAYSPVFDYLPGRKNPINWPLWKWVGGKPELQRCVDEGLRDGTFYAVTCHEAVLFRFVAIARRCRRSNDFTLGGAG
jgi:hypothetical protein